MKRTSLLPFALAGAAFTAALAAPDPDPGAAYPPALDTARARHGSLANAWYRSLERSRPAGPPPLIVRLLAPKCFGGASLSVEFVQSPELPRDGRAWTTTGPLAFHPADCAKLAVAGTPESGSLAGEFSVDFPDELAPSGVTHVTVKVTATVNGGKIAGQFVYAALAAETRGPVSGAVLTAGGAASAAASAPARGLPALDLNGKRPSDLYAAATLIEADACSLYRSIRALAAVDGDRTGYATALERNPIPMPIRPRFQAGKAPPRPAAKTAAELNPSRGRPAPKKAIVPDLDALDEPGLDKESGPPAPATPAPAATDDPKEVAARLATMRAISDHLTALDERVAAWLTNAPVPPVQRGLTFDDPVFGPWYGTGSLAADAAGVNRWPADGGGPGVQDWPFVLAWSFVGPFSFPPPGWDAVLLPDCLPTEDAEFDGKRGRNRWRPAPSGANDCTMLNDLESLAEAVDEDQQPAGGNPAPPPPVATYYCATTIEAEKEAKVLLAAGCSGQMVVWHDGRMVARGPGGVPTPDIPNETLMFHVNLHPGANRLLVRCDAEAFGLFTHRIPGSASYFWMRACRRGAPADPASSREWLARVEARKKDLPNLPPGTQGFRYDQTGYYAGADPVTVWDLERGINVRWIAPLERWSKGSPIVVGNRVFAQADPHVLVCLDAATGKVLWRRASNVLETMDPKLHQESEALHAKFLEAKAAAAPALAALGPDYAARLRALAAQGKPLPQAVVDLRGMEHEAHKAYGAFFGHLQQHAKLSSPPWEGAYSGNYVGYTFATPVTDGRRVFVKCGTGVVAAYDLDGNRLWMARTPYLASGAHFCGSPVLADDLVVIAQIQDPNAGQFSDWLFTLTALDAATGKVRWTGKAHEGGRQSSSPVVMRLTNGGEDMTVIVTAGGTVVRAADGKILVNGLRGGCGTATPTPVGDTLYRIESGQAGGVRFLMLDRDHVGARWLWSANRRYNALYAGVGHRDGILFGLGHGGSQCLGGRALDLIDVVTGTKLERPFNAELKKEGIYACPSEGYIPPVASARHLYVAVRGQRHASSLREELPDRWKPWAYVSVLQWGVKGRFVAHNQVPAQLTPHPALAGDAVFLRNEEELMCFGYTGDEGRAYEAEVNAATLLADIEPAAPTDPAGAALWREGVERARSYLQKVIELRPASEAATRAKALLAQVATPR